ncbi:MAG: hypothetical protein PHS93_09510 [Candidatus Omnitrophica bacterium]|jgi:hypothetical protein|nr:hypothetical protein [Candidatus Omnitrophota bacterium]MDD5353384.1 hypothetical protein [Candidatus Omnitrophota bacterium]
MEENKNLTNQESNSGTVVSSAETGGQNDGYIKIITAIQLIQYFTARIESVRSELMIVGADNKKVYEVGKKQKDYLENIAKKLHELAEDVGDYCNNCDMVEEIDVKLTGAAYEFLQGKIS